MKLLLNVLFVLSLLGFVVVVYTLVFPFAAFVLTCVILGSIAANWWENRGGNGKGMSI